MKRMYLFNAALICAVLVAGKAQAQAVGGDVFLKGNFVEVGIGHLGYYGSDSSAPTGYHPHNGTVTTLGFVADPAMDGWSVGSPAYMGDYFTPGTPFEGWELQIGSQRCQAYNVGSAGSLFDCSGGTATGVNTSYATSGSQVIGTWTGMVDSVGVTQVTTLDTNGLYFTVKVTLTNLSTTSLDDLYYTRTLDPDNDETWPGGSFVTNNVVQYQMPDSLNAVVVSATGLSSTSPYLGLGTTDTNAKAFIYNLWPLSSAQDLSAVYNETYSAFYDMGTAHSGDIAIGLVMHVAHLATVDSAGDSTYRTTAAGMHPANTASFTYFYSFSSAATDSAIRAGAPAAVSTLGVNNVNAIADIKVYPNPAQNMINITNLNGTDRIMVYDMMGKAVNGNWNVSRQGLNTFSIAGMPAGSYIFVVCDANGVVRSRVPVKKM